MKKIFDWLIDKWLAGFITTSIFFLLKLYIDLPKDSKENFFYFEWLRELMNTKLSLLTVIMIIISILLLTQIEKAIKNSKSKKRGPSYLKAPKNNFEKYNKDAFGVTKNTWTWRYEWRPYDQKFAIIDLKPSCNQCGTPMELDLLYSQNSAECHKCRLEGRPHTFRVNEYISDVEKEIIRRIQNNEVHI